MNRWRHILIGLISLSMTKTTCVVMIRVRNAALLEDKGQSGARLRGGEGTHAAGQMTVRTKRVIALRSAGGFDG